MGVAAHIRAHARRASPGSRRRSGGRPVGLCMPREKTCRSPSRQRASPTRSRRSVGTARSHSGCAAIAARVFAPAGTARLYHAAMSRWHSAAMLGLRVVAALVVAIVASSCSSGNDDTPEQRPGQRDRRGGPRTRRGDRPAVRCAPLGRRPGSAGVAQGRARRRGAHVDPGGDDVRGRRARLGAGPLPAQSGRSHDPGAYRRRVRGRVRPADGSTICC